MYVLCMCFIFIRVASCLKVYPINFVAWSIYFFW